MIRENDYKLRQKLTSKVQKTVAKSDLERKKHRCEVCGYLLNCHSSLKQHEKKHNVEKQHTCDYCHKKFTRSDHLNTHRRTHTGNSIISVLITNQMAQFWRQIATTNQPV